MTATLTLTPIGSVSSVAVSESAVTLASDTLVQTSLLSTDENPAFQILGDGKLRWGAGGSSAVDVELYRVSANRLGLLDAFQITRATVGSSTLESQVDGDTVPRGIIFADGKIEWGAGGATARDTNLYRSAANVLSTDDKLDAASINVQVKAGAPIDGDITGGAASGDMVLDTTNSRIYFRVGSTWKSALLA